jgi:hypothetical protein
MNTDVRIDVGFWDHPKTVKLERRLGLAGVKSLQILWTWTAMKRPSGTLAGMNDEDIEIAARWPGDVGAFVAAVTAPDCTWLDKDAAGNYVVHDWLEHNPWAANVEARSDKARLSRLANGNKEMARRLSEAGCKGLNREHYEALMAGDMTIDEYLGIAELHVDTPLTPIESDDQRNVNETSTKR